MTDTEPVRKDLASQTLAERFETMAAGFNSAAAVGMTKTLQWNITGDEGGVWAFRIVDGVGQLIPGGVEEPDVTFTTSPEVWLAIAEGKQDPMKAFMAGKLKVSGDMMIAMQAPELFPAQGS
jgi:putative sterol carrier protein